MGYEVGGNGDFRSFTKRARVAVARKLAVLLHRLWRSETDFRWA